MFDESVLMCRDLRRRRWHQGEVVLSGNFGYLTRTSGSDLWLCSQDPDPNR